VLKRAALVLVFYLLSASGVLAAGPGPSPTAASQFVQRFYDWYTPLAFNTGHTPSYIVALDKRGAQFDAGLSRALREDAEAQAKMTDDIIGLDFDPFLAAQDPDSKYAAGEVTEKDGVYLVNVYGVRKGKRSPKPDVVAELKATKGSFRFTNFLYSADGVYGADGDLLGILKQLSDERAHPSQ
jgi:hypothetical protein